MSVVLSTGIRLDLLTARWLSSKSDQKETGEKEKEGEGRGDRCYILFMTECWRLNAFLMT